MASHTLSFLRPMALPRPATISQFLRRYATEATSPSITAHPKPSFKFQQSRVPKPKPARKAPAFRPSLPRPYTIHLTPSKQYPIYTLAKRGGNMKLTKVRKIEGDLAVLKNDLISALVMEEKDVSINQLTRHILVKGHKRPEIEAYFKSIEPKAPVPKASPIVPTASMAEPVAEAIV